MNESSKSLGPGRQPGDRDGVIFQSHWVDLGAGRQRSIRVVEKGVMIRSWLYNLEGVAEIPVQVGLIFIGIGTTICRGMLRDRYKVAVVDRRGEVFERERIARKWPITGRQAALDLARKLAENPEDAMIGPG